ncbi:hypothetical protein [Thermaurantiacus sp.]
MRPKLAPPAPRHVRLLASLPRLPDPFDPRTEPAGALRLARRLKALTPAEAHALEVIEAGFERARLVGLQDAAVVARARAALVAAPGPAAAAIAAVWQLRGVAALAARQAAGESGPDPLLFDLPGMAAVAPRIRANWHRPGFALSGPAAASARDAMSREGNPAALWRAMLLREAAVLRAAAFPPRFDFAAVVLHLLGWLLAVEARAASPDVAGARIRRALAAAAAPVEARLSALA